MKYQEVLDYYETKEKIAAELCLSVQTVAKWKATEQVPYLYQLAIQTLTKGKLKAD